MDSTLIWPYYTKVVVCLGCRHRFIFRQYGDRMENLLACLNESYLMELHVKNCHGPR